MCLHFGVNFCGIFLDGLTHKTCFFEESHLVHHSKKKIWICTSTNYHLLEVKINLGTYNSSTLHLKITARKIPWKNGGWKTRLLSFWAMLSLFSNYFPGKVGIFFASKKWKPSELGIFRPTQSRNLELTHVLKPLRLKEVSCTFFQVLKALQLQRNIIEERTGFVVFFLNMKEFRDLPVNLNKQHLFYWMEMVLKHVCFSSHFLK